MIHQISPFAGGPPSKRRKIDSIPRKITLFDEPSWEKRMIKEDVVYEVFHRETGQAFVLKYVSKNEYNYAKKFSKDPHVVTVHRRFQPKDKYAILMEKADSDLFQFITKNQEQFIEETIYRLFLQIVQGVQSLHKQKIAHRDLKPENLLVFNGDSDPTVKLCDFEFSKKMIKEQELKGAGSYLFASPEVLKQEKYDYKIDHWALGVILYALSYKTYPFLSNEKEGTRGYYRELTPQILNPCIDFPDIPERSEELKSLIQALLTKDPEKRLGSTHCCEEILNSAWFKKCQNPKKQESVEDWIANVFDVPA